MVVALLLCCHNLSLARLESCQSCGRMLNQACSQSDVPVDACSAYLCAVCRMSDPLLLNYYPGITNWLYHGQGPRPGVALSIP